jgi:hypothetical protein
MRLRASLAAGMAATLIAAPALAQSPYLCTGVSENERMEAEGFDHSLRLVFAQPDGHYLADVHTRPLAAGEPARRHLRRAGDLPRRDEDRVRGR